MNTLKFEPEGWNDEITKVDKNNIQEYIESKKTLQGLVRKCDESYNLYINFDNGLIGKMPREEIEAIKTEINGLPKTNLCIGKVHKFVQFKIKDIDNGMN